MFFQQGSFACSTDPAMFRSPINSTSLMPLSL
jgi:hypothetical protein